MIMTIRKTNTCKQQEVFVMKKFFKVMTLVLVVAMLAAVGIFSLVGCGGTSNKLTVATEAYFAPFEYIKEGTVDEYTGFDMDLADAVAKKLGYDGIKVVNLEFDSIVANVQADPNSIGIAAMTINPERLDSVAFSTPYFKDSYQVLVVKAGDTAYDAMTTKEQILGSLADKNVNFAKGQTGQFFVTGNKAMNYPGVNCKKGVVCDNATLVFAAVSGATDGSVGMVDKEVAKKYCAENNDVKYIDIPLVYEEYGIAINKSNTELKTKIDTALSELKADGTIDNLLKKYNIA